MSAELLVAKLLVANRGEVAIRIARAARDLEIASVMVFAEDDARAAHVRAGDEAIALPGSGPSAYLDGRAILEAAARSGCDAVHPGYGFLSERADFASACREAGLRFVGPTPEQLALFGDKVRAHELARECQVPTLAATGTASIEDARRFFDDHGAVVIKAQAGGGGRGIRAVTEAGALEEAYARCQSEAKSAFGIEHVYLERLVQRARHVEVQVAGDGERAIAIGDRDCSIQRRFQKLIELAPSPGLSDELRRAMADAALTMARRVHLVGLCTFEFLLDEGAFVFIEANPRLQVEHTVTEEVSGVDLVRAQIMLAAGRSLEDAGLGSIEARGAAIQLRILAETLEADGTTRPGAGTIQRLELPSGPGVRVDTDARAGGAISPRYDNLIAKLIVRSPGAGLPALRPELLSPLLRAARRALRECAIEGVPTNLELLSSLLARDELSTYAVHTRLLESIASELVTVRGSETGDGRDVRAPMAGRVVAIKVATGDVVARGAELVVLEAMKMEHPVLAPRAGRVISILTALDRVVAAGQVLALFAPDEAQVDERASARALDLDAIRPDLRRVLDRRALTLDAARPEAVAKRRRTGARMARENIADLCDDFDEYGAFAIAAQKQRRSVEDLVKSTPADGLVTGLGSINTALFGPERSRAAVLAYDYTVLAGTQGVMNHQKTDRLLELARRLSLPVVLFAEGGGGRPGDTDFPVIAGLHVPTFASYASLSGQVPVIGIVSGRCFAGNAALLGCSDVIIATRTANIGMGGPAMIEGGGLGRFAPEEIGPASVMQANGVIDVLVDDEAAAVAVAKKYLAFFQGPLASWDEPEPRALRSVIPESRARAYEVRKVIEGLADRGSVLELRSGFGVGIATALMRIEGRPLGVIANNPFHLGGAIDPDAADKAARFMQLCDAFGLPLLSLIDTPGFMVGPEIETRAQVRHVSRMFLIASHLRVPHFAVVLRKGYGLGAQSMAFGGFHAPAFTVSWPTGEFGAMGLEGAVKLGFRKELESVPAGPARDAAIKQLVDAAYAHGSAINMASMLEIDAVIDPVETRGWIARGLRSAAPLPARARFIDAW